MLSRLWYLVLALAVGGALAGAFLNKSAASREADFHLEEQLRRDRVEAELWMRLDARLRLDALASIAVEPEVRQTLRSASGHQGTTSNGARRRLSQTLDELNAKLEEGKGDLLFAIDTEGEVVATLDKSARDYERLDRMPLVRDALRGFMRDDVWVFNGEVFRMAARPVFDGGRYVGAVVHGMRVGDDLASRLGAKLPNASVVFFYRDRVIGTHTGGATAPTSTDLKNALSAGAEPEDDSIEIGERMRAVLSPIRGEAAHAGVGYAIGRTGSPVGLGGLFDNTFQEDVASLPWAIVLGIPVALLLFGLFLLYMEHDKAVSILRKSSASLSKNELNSLPAGQLRRHYRKIAENLNAALRAGVGFKEDAERRASVDLDQILSSTRDNANAGYFGFPAEAPTTKQSAVVPEPEPKPSAAGQEIAPPPEPAAKPREVPTPTPSPADTSTARPQHPQASRANRTPSSWPSRPPSSRQPVAGTVRHGQEMLTPVPEGPPTRPQETIDEYDGFDDAEESTQIKHVPQELLEAIGAEESEDTHFREVFEQFLAKQRECGVSVSGLTFDKFVRKLHAAREQVIKRHNASAVRFTVYVKEGRAALKASPVKQ